jgi:hypothetical protein
MIRRPRCRGCAQRIWPWQKSAGWGYAGAPDNDRRRSAMKHVSCIERARGEREQRRAQRNARVESSIEKAREQ